MGRGKSRRSSRSVLGQLLSGKSLAAQLSAAQEERDRAVARRDAAVERRDVSFEKRAAALGDLSEARMGLYEAKRDRDRG
jgi:hypothetical protein